MEIVALNCSGNPLAPARWREAITASAAYRTVELAAKLGVKKIVMMSGLPGHGRTIKSPTDHLDGFSPDHMPT